MPPNDLSDIKKILSKFKISLDNTSIKQTPTSGNITYAIKSKEGKFILRLCPDAEPRHRSKKEIEAELELIFYLKSKGFPTPTSIPMKDGAIVIESKNRFGYLRKFEDGGAIFNPSLKQITKFGETLGWLHQLTEGYKTKYKRLHIFDLENAKKYFKESKQAILKTRIKNNKDFVSRIKKELFALNFPQSLPKGMIHEDLGRRHVLWKKGKISCILDFDRTYYGKLLLDLGQSLRGWCFTDWKKWSDQKFKCLMRGYETKRELKDNEIKRLGDSVKFALLERSIAFALRGHCKSAEVMTKQKHAEFDRIAREQLKLAESLKMSDKW